MKKITVFTPTYNRAYILEHAYQSLVKQTNQNFTWLIIDDGSTDDTYKFIKKWKKDGKIDIEYFYQENSGKHIAHNKAVKECKTDYMLILDSDDYLSNNAIEILMLEIKKIDNNKKISGIIGNRFYPKSDKCLGTQMPPNINYASSGELYEKYNFKGDTLRMYKTEILKQYLFPKIGKEKFMYENVIFDPIDAKYKMLINRDKLYYGTYLEDGYTKNTKRIKEENPVGYAYSLNIGVKYAITIRKKIKWTIIYILWCKKMHISKYYRNFNSKMYFIFVYPMALIYNWMRGEKNEEKFS